VDAWLEAGRRSLDLPSRTAAYHAVQRRLAEDLPIVPLWHEDNLAVIRRNLRGFRILPNARFAPLLEVTKAH
jgi:peptide/nickel transport system substrate-binding protein